MRILPALATAAFSVACGPLPTERLTATWDVSPVNLVDAEGLITCHLIELALGLTQTGKALTGYTSTFTRSCQGASGTSISSPVLGAAIRNGQARGDSVLFDIIPYTTHFRGIVVGDSIQGVVTDTLVTNVRTIVRTAPFTARRRR